MPNRKKSPNRCPACGHTVHHQEPVRGPGNNLRCKRCGTVHKRKG